MNTRVYYDTKNEKLVLADDLLPVTIGQVNMILRMSPRMSVATDAVGGGHTAAALVDMGLVEYAGPGNEEAVRRQRIILTSKGKAILEQLTGDT